MQPKRITSARQRDWLGSVLHDYSTHSLDDLTKVHASLLADFAAADGFGLIAGRALRRHCIERLQDVGAELQRRAALDPIGRHAPPRPLRSPALPDRAAAA